MSTATEIDERKRKRMISNRESARRSRIRKQQHLEDLISQRSELENERLKLEQRIDASRKLWEAIVSENKRLMAFKAALNEELEAKRSFLSDFNRIEMPEPSFHANPMTQPLVDVSRIGNGGRDPWQLWHSSLYNFSPIFY